MVLSIFKRSCKTTKFIVRAFLSPIHIRTPPVLGSVQPSLRYWFLVDLPLPFCGLFLDQWCHLTVTGFDYFDDVQFLSFVAFAFAVIPKAPHYVDEDIFAYYDFVVLGFCLFVFRQNLTCVVETSLLSPHLPDCAILCPVLLIELIFIYTEVWGRDVIWNICVPLSQHHVLKAPQTSLVSVVMPVHITTVDLQENLKWAAMGPLALFELFRDPGILTWT